ncbi:YktB family protein [Peribacillus loiseleuriae]|uniref:YktB family protein n=1 Tax=Peribacillus loiseleuriae TaxID=1679170 RepID=UPI003CFE8FE6
MNVTSFSATDFNVFKIEGLDYRMQALKDRIRPKLDALGDHFASELSAMTGQELFPHVAKHARRTINPPNDTWVAFAASKRGYKMMPHFQIGLWGSHMFVWFAVIYEAPIKVQFGEALEKSVKNIKEMIPNNFVWSLDHTKPEVIPHETVSSEELTAMFKRLQEVKKAEILCGIKIPREDAINLSDDEFFSTIHDAFVHLMPLYRLTQTLI